MFHENEVVMLFLCIGVMIFIFHNRKNLTRFKRWGLLFTSFLMLLVACISTVAEGFLMEDIFNYLEHFCYAGSGVILIIWCYKVFQKKRE